jgi:hypothetical protein
MGSISFVPHLHPPTPEPWIELDGSLKYVDCRPINWDALLALLTGVRRLDLLEIPGASSHVKRIVEAALKHCPQLEALIIPEQGGEANGLPRAVYEAMKT